MAVGGSIPPRCSILDGSFFNEGVGGLQSPAAFKNCFMVMIFRIERERRVDQVSDLLYMITSVCKLSRNIAIRIDEHASSGWLFTIVYNGMLVYLDNLKNSIRDLFVNCGGWEV